MRVDQLGDRLPDFALTNLAEAGITELNPPQQLAVEAGLFSGNSLLVASPTASGKTLIATLAVTNSLVGNENKKALYLVPLKALASEKYQDYRQFFADSEVEVALSLGDKDSADRWLENKDLIILTVEKLDSLLRHNPAWIKDVDVVIEDEIHLLNDPSRGPTLEVTLTRLRKLIDFQLIGLSATINNADALANWLDCELIISDYRPVKLETGLYWDTQIEFYQSKPEKSESSSMEFKTGKQQLEEERAKADVERRPITDKYGRGTMNLLHDSLKEKKQAINFVRSRKSAEKEAERLGKVSENFVSSKEQEKLNQISQQIANALSSPTKQCKRLAKCVRKGSAFHHAGLVSEQRSLIEDNFRQGTIKSISATPTLAMGLSLPAHRIILRDLKRYSSSGLDWIPVLEYYQMAGRAGRPEHHDEGQAIAIAKSAQDKEKIIDRYIFGEPENIYSKLAVEPVLRTHILSLVVTGFAPDQDKLLDFFAKTFYAYQYQDLQELNQKILDVLRKLEDYDFLEINEKQLEATSLGKRVAKLYLDPYTAHYLLTNIRESAIDQKKPINLLYLLANCVEMKPLLRVRNSEQDEIEDLAAQAEDNIEQEVPEPWDFDYDPHLRAIKTAFVLYSWVNEIGEDKLMDKYNVTPGTLRAKVNNADWLLYSLRELTRLKNWKQKSKEAEKVRIRLKHGIKQELLPLVDFKQIGRVRARRLFDNDIQGREDVRQAPFETLKKILGKKTAKKLKEQVGVDNVFDREDITSYFD